MLYILQGVPGSGKSTIAQALFDAHCGNAFICSTDDYFYVDGVYKFEPAKLAEYHKKNLENAISLMNSGYHVIVDNTNIQRWACREYVRHAVKIGDHVQFIRVIGDSRWKSVHGVPVEAIERMRNQMEDLTVESVLASKCPWEVAA